MFRLNETDARCEALFASALQRSEAPSASLVAREISRTLGELGTEARRAASPRSSAILSHPRPDAVGQAAVANLPVELPFCQMVMWAARLD